MNMPKIKVSISIDDAHLEQIREISQKLQSAGMLIEQISPIIGIISGSVESDQINAFYQVEGVQHIEPEESYQLSPPDSEIQ